ncbi:uncharacterized protein N0V89_002922 [Didymosphaeria variabile]|uniref:YDG domain-containing protein n=1 Tax=Didymosphaeria variabile TaxID=1932322 RepID=A0A9W9CEW2_9PLEO|nr:uncharacterized protein N0V89_002922 [Didymosphaeria variabile]KAJ4358340.1 hypothetical protein N0V89_002922 [Didymosphaeria variabile]
MSGKDEVLFNTPKWLLDWQAEASEQFSDFSLSDEFQKIHEAKARGEDPLITVYHVSHEDLEQFSEVSYQWNKPTESGDQLRVREEHRSSMSDEVGDDEARNARRLAKLKTRKASQSSVGDARKATRNEIKSSASGFAPPEETIAESSKAGAARRPSASLHTPTAGTSTAEVEKTEVKTLYEPKAPPDWLRAILTTSLNRELKRPDKDRTQALCAIEAFKDRIRRCEDATAAGKLKAQLEKLFDELRDYVHKAEVLLKGVDKYVVRKKNMLTVENGLPRIFASTQVDYPWDLKADAWQLYLRWYEQDFKPDLLRGIVTRKEKNRSSDRIDPEWAKKISPNFHGEGHLVLGQWWPTQLCAKRDGAHGAPQGGIWGQKGKGAYSIVLSSGGYKDKDDGDEIWYSGTDNKNSNNKDPTENTQRLIESCEEFPNQPVRVLRSSQLPLTNRYRPRVGLRYDGLYKVVGYEILDKAKQEHLFKLVRCENQNPIRCEDNAARRPTKYEEDEYTRLKKDGRYQ